MKVGLYMIKLGVPENFMERFWGELKFIILSLINLFLLSQTAVFINSSLNKLGECRMNFYFLKELRPWFIFSLDYCRKMLMLSYMMLSVFINWLIVKRQKVTYHWGNACSYWHRWFYLIFMCSRLQREAS